MTNRERENIQYERARIQESLDRLHSGSSATHKGEGVAASTEAWVRETRHLCGANYSLTQLAQLRDYLIKDFTAFLHRFEEFRVQEAAYREGKRARAQKITTAPANASKKRKNARHGRPGPDTKHTDVANASPILKMRHGWKIPLENGSPVSKKQKLYAFGHVVPDALSKNREFRLPKGLVNADEPSSGPRVSRRSRHMTP